MGFNSGFKGLSQFAVLETYDLFIMFLMSVAENYVIRGSTGHNLSSLLSSSKLFYFF